MIISKKSSGNRAKPIIFDSPHSGQDFPEDFKSPLDRDILSQCEDNYVDRLIEDLHQDGADLLIAEFPRLYIDVNRNVTDLRALDFKHGHDKLKISNSKTARHGRGLIWQWVIENDEDKAAIPIYYPDEKPTQEEVLNRIEDYWKPYHDLLAELILEKKQISKTVYHFNVHSCPRFQIVSKKENADITLGNVFNKSADYKLMLKVKKIFEDEGFTVSLNKPFSGGYIVKRHGKPKKGVQSIQIEIAKDLYMDEDSGEYLPEKALRVKKTLSKLTKMIC
ncbi:MAG: hypothetical protein CMP22_06940 [Rickettsiales bacterium]|nr:hypothetical protein [Rickettsiales bacterium]|tara:strand:- start:6226 stop:7059 length:834 start_codon:yes stop_codon:yes gene_type:complete